MANKLFLIFVLAITGCTGLRNISSVDPLYIGHSIKFSNKDDKLKEQASIKNVLKPKPNATFLWMRPALARNNMLSNKAKKRKFWKNKIAEPVLVSQTNPNHVAAAIQNRIFHNGYFHNTVAFDTIRLSQRKVKIQYTITLRGTYRFESVVFPKAISDLTQKISDGQQRSLLKKGDIYKLDAVKKERIRIDQDLKEHGYIYFNPDFISLKADTVTGDHQINAEVTVKPETPPESRIPYTIRKVFIYDDHGFDNTLIDLDTLQFGNYYLISEYKALRFEALQQGIFLKPGELHSPSNPISYAGLTSPSTI